MLPKKDIFVNEVLLYSTLNCRLLAELRRMIPPLLKISLTSD
jgi:hypothetical protein